MRCVKIGALVNLIIFFAFLLVALRTRRGKFPRRWSRGDGITNGQANGASRRGGYRTGRASAVSTTTASATSTSRQRASAPALSPESSEPLSPLRSVVVFSDLRRPFVIAHAALRLTSASISARSSASTYGSSDAHLPGAARERRSSSDTDAHDQLVRLLEESDAGAPIAVLSCEAGALGQPDVR